MSIWGRVIGGVAGFAMGGPLGAIMGVVAGHAYDKMKAEGAAPGAEDAQTRQIADNPSPMTMCSGPDPIPTPLPPIWAGKCRN